MLQGTNYECELQVCVKDKNIHTFKVCMLGLVCMRGTDSMTECQMTQNAKIDFLWVEPK
jgi:hypothetical protein